MKALLVGMTLVLASHAMAANESKVVATKPAAKANLEMLGGLVTTNGDFGGSFLAGVNFAVDRTVPVRLGFDSGILFGSGTGLPLLISVSYASAERTRTANPYIGALVGPVIGLGSMGVFDQGDSVELAILARGGLSFAVADALDMRVEMQMGGITGVFFIAPMFGATIYL